MTWCRWPIYERVVVNLRSGQALRGLLIARRGPLLVLTDTTLFEPGAEPVVIDGQAYVERDNVAFIQAHAGG